MHTVGEKKKESAPKLLPDGFCSPATHYVAFFSKGAFHIFIHLCLQNILDQYSYFHWMVVICTWILLSSRHVFTNTNLQIVPIFSAKFSMLFVRDYTFIFFIHILKQFYWHFLVYFNLNWKFLLGKKKPPKANKILWKKLGEFVDSYMWIYFVKRHLQQNMNAASERISIYCATALELSQRECVSIDT